MYTEASLCGARMNHPHGRAKPNTLAAFYPPDVVQLTAAGLKAERDRAVCCEELSEEAGLFAAPGWGDVAWRRLDTDTLQKAERDGL